MYRSTFNRMVETDIDDQYFLVPSWLLAIVFTVLACYSNTHGMTDRHIWDLKPGKLHKDIEVSQRQAKSASQLLTFGTECLGCTIRLRHGHLITENLCALFLSPHGSWYLQQILEVRHLGRHCFHGRIPCRLRPSPHLQLQTDESLLDGV